MSGGNLKIDEWVWGREKIVWGFDPSHHYTFKIIEPKVGRLGCMSLQYHREKSESWLVIRGAVWALVVAENKVCTRIMRPGDVQNLEVGCLHRLMGLTADAQVAEPSTPDRHAADKSVPKDVVRLHCVQGRAVEPARSDLEIDIVKECIRRTEEAISAAESGQMPPEYNRDVLDRHGAGNVNS